MTYFNDTYDECIVPITKPISREQFMSEIKAASNGHAYYSTGNERGFGIGISDDDNSHGFVVGEY